MTRQIIRKTLKPLKYSAVAPYGSDDGALDAIDYVDGGGGSFSGGSGSFSIKKPGQGNYIVRAKLEPIGDFFFTLTHGDGTEITEASGLLDYIKVYNSSLVLLATTTVWDSEQNSWHVSLNDQDDADANGYFVVYTTTENGIPTQYPYRYRTWWDAADLIQAGSYTDTIPYWKTQNSYDSEIRPPRVLTYMLEVWSSVPYTYREQVSGRYTGDAVTEDFNFRFYIGTYRIKADVPGTRVCWSGLGYRGIYPQEVDGPPNLTGTIIGETVNLSFTYQFGGETQYDTGSNSNSPTVSPSSPTGSRVHIVEVTDNAWPPGSNNFTFTCSNSVVKDIIDDAVYLRPSVSNTAIW